MGNEKLLVITKSEDETVTGYEMKEENGEAVKVFDGPVKHLFYLLMGYEKDDNCRIRVLGTKDSLKFVEEHVDEPVLIWRRNQRNFMAFGRGPARIGIYLTAKNMKELGQAVEKVELNKGFKAIVIHGGEAAGVYELESGGLVGDTVEDVNADIAACDDIEIMKAQIAECMAERNEGIRTVSYEEFGIAVSQKG